MPGDPRFDWSGPASGPNPGWQPPSPPGAPPSAAPQRPVYRVVQQPGSSTGSTIALAVGIPVAVILIIGILAAVAIPVFLNQRAKAQGSGPILALPAAIQGIPVLDDPAVQQQVLSSLNSLPADLRGQADARAYGFPGDEETLRVIVINHRLTAAGRQSFDDGFRRSLGVTAELAHPGPLNSSAHCATTQGTDVCWTTAANGVVIAAEKAAPQPSPQYEQLIAIRVAVSGSAAAAGTTRSA